MRIRWLPTPSNCSSREPKRKELKSLRWGTWAAWWTEGREGEGRNNDCGGTRVSASKAAGARWEIVGLLDAAEKKAG